MVRSQSQLSASAVAGRAGQQQHLDRFLASVQRTNAETEWRLGSGESAGESGLDPPPGPHPGPGTNLRRGRTISNRWKSVESLGGASGGGPARRSAPPRTQSRESLGPRGFTSMVSLLSPGPAPALPVRNPREKQSEAGAGAGAGRERDKLARADSLPLDSLSVRSSCSCNTEATHQSALPDTKPDKEEPIPRPVMSDTRKTKIEYLGSVPIDSKATDLSNLQYPMKNLYLQFIEQKKMGHQQLPGTMEISETGLKVNYIRELHKGVQEIFNPFPTIAVWAAVKFVHKKEQVETFFG